MNLREYQIEALKTAIYSPSNNISYPVLGLIDELGEFTEKLEQWFSGKDIELSDLFLELGDVLWYFVNVCYNYDVHLGEFRQEYVWSEFDPSETFLIASKIAGIAKKNLRDGTLDKNRLFNLMFALLARLNGAAELIGSTLEQIADLNISKIRDRQARGVLKGSGDRR